MTALSLIPRVPSTCADTRDSRPVDPEPFSDYFVWYILDSSDFSYLIPSQLGCGMISSSPMSAMSDSILSIFLGGTYPDVRWIDTPRPTAQMSDLPFALLGWDLSTEIDDSCMHAHLRFIDGDFGVGLTERMIYAIVGWILFQVLQGSQQPSQSLTLPSLSSVGITVGALSVVMRMAQSSLELRRIALSKRARLGSSLGFLGQMVVMTTQALGQVDAIAVVNRACSGTDVSLHRSSIAEERGYHR